MSQPPRPNPPGWFHVMNRGARRRDIFFDDDDRLMFLDLLAGMTRRFDVQVVSYCLMGNHYHLALHCPEPALSRAMQWLGSRYVRRFNQKHEFDGPLCRARFHSVEIKDDAQLIAVVRYIHRNPLDLRPNADLAGYEWSSHSAYLGLCREPTWLHTDVPLSFFSNDTAAFRRTVETALDFDAVKNRPTQRALPTMARPHPSSTIELAHIERAVAEAGGVLIHEIRTHQPGRTNPCRSVALLLAADEAMLDSQALAAAFDYASVASARVALSSARRKASTDPLLAQLLAEARAILRTS